MQKAYPLTVGDLKALVANLDDDMPLHHRGSMGDYPVGIEFAMVNLAVSKVDPQYVAAIEDDPVWSKKKHCKEFGEKFLALCVI